MKPILALIIASTMAFALYSIIIKLNDVKAEPKPVCIEAHLGINKSETIVLCGKVVNLKEIE